MEPAQREQILRMLLPALGVALVYMFAVSRGKELDAARAGLEAAQASAVGPESILPARMKLSDLAAEKTKLTAEKTALDERWSRLTALPAKSSTARTAALQQLTKMLWDRGLYPFEESPADGNGSMPGSLDDMLKKVATPGATSQSRLWQIRFYGRYSDVAATLAALGDADHMIVPVSLSMSEAKTDTPWRIWTLVLWV